MPKIIISKPYNLKDMSTNYDDYDSYLLYLAYIEDNGYILISQTNSSLFYAISSKVNPANFYKNPTDDNQAYQCLLSEIKKHLKKYYDEINEYFNHYGLNKNTVLYGGVLEANDDIIDEEDIFEELTSNLDDIYNNPRHIFKSRDYTDKDIKNLINFPVDTFKNQLRRQDVKNKNLITSEDKIKDKRDDVKNKVKSAITSIKDTQKLYQLDDYGFFKDILNQEEIKELIGELTLGLTDDNQFNQYHQDYRGIFTIETQKRDEELIEVPKVIAKLNILDAVRVIDPLDINPTTYILKIFNINEDREVIYNYLTYDELVNKFKESRTFYNDNQIPYVLNHYLNDGCDNVRYEAYKEGFYLINDKVIENTNILDIKYDKETLKESIKLFNDVLAKRSLEGKINDCEVYRFSLWSPFSFILKQLGITDSLYALILIGASQTNKTGSIFIANHFYNHTNEENTGSTPSVLGSRLEENTFNSVFDECSHLFDIPEAINIMKRAIYEKVSRGVKDKTNNRNIDDFMALGLPIFILNERLKDGFKDFIQNRYHRVKYTSNSIISDASKKEFNMRFMPRSPNSPLNDLKYIGRAFSDKLIEVIEDNTQHHLLYDMEALTITILKEISEYAGEPFIDEMYEVREDDIDYDYDLMEDIRNKLNQEFKNKNRGISKIGLETLYLSVIRGDFNFIKFNADKQTYFISPNELRDHVNKMLNDGMIETEALIDGLELKLKVKKYLSEDKGYSFKNQHFNDNNGHRIQKRGFLLDGADVLYYIFRITMSEKQFRELEAWDNNDDDDNSEIE